MKKELIIGGLAIASAGLIIGGAVAFNASQDKFDLRKENPAPEISEEDRQKLEEFYFEQLLDSSRYIFCTGQEKISGTYLNTLMGEEKGWVNYRAEEINIFDKESQKLYLLGRTINYQYQGNGIISNQVGSGKIKIKETGNLTEYYKKNQAPVKLDYFAKAIYPAPDRKTKDWVTIETELTGEVLGFSQTTNEVEHGDAKTFCFPFNLGEKTGADIFSGNFSFTSTDHC